MTDLLVGAPIRAAAQCVGGFVLDCGRDEGLVLAVSTNGDVLRCASPCTTSHLKPFLCSSWHCDVTRLVPHRDTAYLLHGPLVSAFSCADARPSLRLDLGKVPRPPSPFSCLPHHRRGLPECSQHGSGGAARPPA